MRTTALTLAAALALVGLVGCTNTTDDGDLVPDEASPNDPLLDDVGQVEPANAALAAAEFGDPFATFVDAGEVADLRDRHRDLVILDVRSADEYAAGHLPGAVNLPGNDLRTPKAEPGEGDSQYLFRTADGELDVARYEQLLGDAGLTADTPVLVYGNHAGKGDGTIPAMILDALGHETVYFLDGVGLTEWQQAGGELATDAPAPSPQSYVADADGDFLWNLDDVLAHVGDEAVFFYDTRSLAEYTGDDTERGNARTGHIPGAAHGDYADFLAADKTLKPAAEVKQILADHGVLDALDAGDTVVLYCQTSTRVSLPYLLLRDLGYDNLAVYDASWHEYGNRDDTPVETGTLRAAAR